LTADSLIQSSGQTSRGFVITTNISILGVVTYSVYAKKNTKDFVVFTDNTLGLGYENSWFDINTGTLGTIAVGRTASIISVGDGWYRCSITVTATVSPSQYLFGHADTNNSITVVDSGGIFIWGAQIVEGTQAKDYFPTTNRLNVPRIDYSNGGCPSILVEPQRTNLLLRSEEFENAYWGKHSGATVAANTAISPSGVQNADTINLVSGSTISRVEKASLSLAANTYYTISIYLKNISLTSGQTFQLRLETSGFDLRGTVDLFNKTNTVGITGTTTTGYVLGTQSASITELSDGWLRCSITVQSGTIAIGTGTFYLINNVDANRSFYAWGAQLEAGAYPTSYIPTIASTVTRNADVISKTGISDLIGQSEGTIFFDGSVPTRVGGSNIISFNYSTASSVTLFKASNGQVRVQIWVGGSAIIPLFGTVFGSERVKIAVVYKSGNSILFINGTQIDINNTSFTFTQDLSVLNLPTGQSYFSNPNDVLINKIALFKTALTNSELAQITTL
jgi:hypothetical protein